MQPDQQTPQQQTQPQLTTTVEAKQTKVQYMTGIWRWNTLDAILEWGADNRIRLHLLDSQGQQGTVLFDCAPQEVKKFQTGTGIGNIYLQDGRRFSLVFPSPVYGMQLASAGTNLVGGPIGVAAGMAIDKRAAEIEESTDIIWWTNRLAEYGVKGFQMSAKRMYNLDKIGLRISLIIFGALTLFAFGLVFVIMMNN